MAGTVTCRRCGDKTPIENSDKNYTAPSCEKCRTISEVINDLGCDKCTKADPMCIGAPGAIACPRRFFWTPTCDLVNELTTHEGVEEIAIAADEGFVAANCGNDHQNMLQERKGPARILVVVD